MSRLDVPEGLRIVLASASPRRRELLSELLTPGSFAIRPVDLDERAFETFDPVESALSIARAKAELAGESAAPEGSCAAPPGPGSGIGSSQGCTLGFVARPLQGQGREDKASALPLVITADTIVFRGGRQFGKPANPLEAVQMLGELSGRTHRVVTAYSVRFGDFMADRAVITKVRFRRLSRAEIEEYVATGESLDKAGGYAIQGGAAGFVLRVEGSLSNVIGLPLDELRADLEQIFALIGSGSPEPGCHSQQ